jgi:hypothetical protein
VTRRHLDTLRKHLGREGEDQDDGLVEDVAVEGVGLVEGVGAEDAADAALPDGAAVDEALDSAPDGDIVTGSAAPLPENA